MRKVSLFKRELEQAALVEIRALYGCEGVTSVTVDPVADAFCDFNWEITAVRRNGDRGPADPAQRDLDRAVTATHKKLRQVYALRIT